MYTVFEYSICIKMSLLMGELMLQMSYLAQTPAPIVLLDLFTSP